MAQRELAAPLLDGEVKFAESPTIGPPLVDAAPPRKGGLVPLLCVTASSLLFGLVSALLKYVGLPPVLMMQVRSLLQWLASLAVCGWRWSQSGKKPVGMRQPLVDILVGPPGLRQLLVGRAFFFWAFMLLWWTSLTALPVGDATSLVYCWPIMTACWGIMLLKERVHRCFWACLLFDIVGLVLVARPSFLFGERDDLPKSAIHPITGVATALAAAFVSPTLPARWLLPPARPTPSSLAPSAPLRTARHHTVLALDAHTTPAVSGGLHSTHPRAQESPLPLDDRRTRDDLTRHLPLHAGLPSRLVCRPRPRCAHQDAKEPRGWLGAV